MSSKDKLENVTFGSESGSEVLELLRDAYLDPQYESKWHPAKIQIVRNRNLMKQFEEKKQEFFVHGHKPEELEEQFGFLVENNVARLESICDLGLHTEDSEYNALGYNCMGVYLCRFVDVCLQHALVKYCGSNIVRLVVFKYLGGRQTTAIPRVASAAEFIEPTQGFDSHVSVIPPLRSDSLQNQYDRSQIYLYEINKLLQPASNPRQILPYAIVTFTVDGVYNSAIDVEPTSAEKLANNPQLQLIIKQINARSESSADAAIPPTGGAVQSTKTLTAPSAGSGRLVAAAAPGHVMGLPSTVLTLGQAGSVHGCQLDPADGASVLENAKLQKVISELNAKLGAEETRKSAFGDAVAAARGNGTMPLTSESLLNAEYLTRRPALSVNLPGMMSPAMGLFSAAGILNVHPTVSSGASVAQFQSSAAAVAAAAALPAYGLLKPGLANVVTSQSMMAAGLIGGVHGQAAVASRPGAGDPAAAAMAAMAGYISFPNAAASFFPQGAMYPYDYVQAVLGAPKDGAALSAAGFYPIQAINPAAAGYAVVGQALKRPLAGDYIPYVEKKTKFF